jgi:hypothetical protein
MVLDVVADRNVYREVSSAMEVRDPKARLRAGAARRGAVWCRGKKEVDQRVG